MSERYKVVCIPCKALYKCSDLPFLLLSYIKQRLIIDVYVYSMRHIIILQCLQWLFKTKYLYFVALTG